MAVKEFIAAIELGSSKITGIAGKKNSDGSIQVLAFAREDASSFMRRGVVYNIDKTTLSISSIMKKLENTLGSRIEKAYVGIGGQSVRSIKNAVKRHLEENVIISQELVDSIMDDNREVPYADQEILDVVPQEYKIGTSLETDPVGIMGNQIEAQYLNIIARTTLKENIYNSFEQAGLEIADSYLSPLVTADALLSDAEKRSGCALIDFGAETTTVSVYNKNLLRHLAVIPLGGRNITKDICSLSIEEEEAENLKKNHGAAYTELKEGEDETATIKLSDGREIELKTFDEIIEARCEEIIANVWNQIRLSGYEDKLLAGIIITGGGAKLKNMDLAIRKRTNIDKDIKLGKTPILLRSGINELTSDLSAYTTLIGLLAKGNDNCCAKEETAKLRGTDLFEQEMRDKRKEEAERKAAIQRAEEARKREEEARIQEEEEKKRKRENSLLNKLGKKFKDLADTITKDE